MMTVDSVLKRLKKEGNPASVEGMARYGIIAKKAYGVNAPTLRKISGEIGKNHKFAGLLWRTGVFDARITAIFIEDPDRVSERQMDAWAKDFDNWAICDACCIHLFRHTPFAWKKARRWCGRKEEFVKRAGFALLATLAVHDKKAKNEKFIKSLRMIERECRDGRNGVKKSVNWALRQIGKRNLVLNKRAVETGYKIRKIDSPSARWIASDALRELGSGAVLKRLIEKEG